MRNISFSLTTNQFRMREKTVTRRLGWKFAKKGDIYMACVKCMGLKPGEKLEKLGPIEIIDARREPLDAMITDLDYGFEEVIKEGFPDMFPSTFVEMFCSHMACKHFEDVTRLEFKYL
jgi:hypothetical protein